MDNKTRDDDEENNNQLHSSSSSPSPNHEFSFTISLHSVSPNTTNRASSVLLPPHHQSSMAIDLSPADDIFFHGHLLPLHLLSHLPPISPRSSTNSIQSFSTDLTDQKQSIHGQTKDPNRGSTNHKLSKSFSLFGLAKWRKGFEDVKRKKMGFDDVSHVIKRMVRPLLFFRRRRNKEFHRPYSFSGDLSGWSGRRRTGEMFSSAPASMRTSPTNSGLLVPASTTTGNNDSTMEELQAAIQAAIAHCKNSIAVEDKLGCKLH